MHSLRMHNVLHCCMHVYDDNNYLFTKMKLFRKHVHFVQISDYIQNTTQKNVEKNAHRNVSDNFQYLHWVCI